MQELLSALENRPEVVEEFILAVNNSTRRSIAIKAFAAEQAPTADALGAAVASADADGDARISRREFSDWLTKYATAAGGEAAASGPPAARQLGLLGLNVAIPMVGFGFMDNFIMILAGDMIDASIGARFGLSMMASAALGNLCSDVMGISLGDVVETMAKKLGLEAPGLSEEQLAMPRTKVCALLSSSLGISVGCVLGMVPLLFLEDDFTREMREVFEKLDANGDGFLASSELEPMFQTLGVPNPAEAAAATVAAIGDDVQTITLEEFLQTAKSLGIKK